MSLLEQLNQQYLALHTEKENAFWSDKMGLRDCISGDFEKKEIRLKEFISDATVLPKIRTELERTDLSNEERTGLEGWNHFFEVNVIETEEAKALQNRIIEMEGELGRTRRSMNLGYLHPESGEFTPSGSVELALLTQTAPDEALRKAAWEGLRSIEPYVLEHGFIDIVKQRNRLGRMLGYEDYYDYKVTINEGFSKERLFELLDALERDTRNSCEGSIEALKQEQGESAAAPWNFEYFTSGDLKAQTDPYFRFDDSVARWGRSFAAMGIRYNGATMTLDLVDRKGKYENGFMHGPVPCFIHHGEFLPARINFTANAVPGQIGSGERATNTLLHEGGHAAHFSNIMMPAPCFSQEFAPTSVAMAETQSMFLDSLLEDPDWLTRYARNENGESMPPALIKTLIEKSHKYRAHQIRKMLVVSYSEKALYEMSEDELTTENILQVLRETEQRLLFQDGAGRPTLAVPHLLSGEASAYYHGYILAEMAVFQTRDYFLQNDGHIMDNPNVGKALTEKYWRPGNSKSFLEIINDLTGKPFSADATVTLVNKSLEEIFAEADSAIAAEAHIPQFNDPVDLNATITVIHGDTTIASTADGSSFEQMSETFAGWIREQE